MVPAICKDSIGKGTVTQLMHILKQIPFQINVLLIIQHVDPVVLVSLRKVVQRTHRVYAGHDCGGNDGLVELVLQ